MRMFYLPYINGGQDPPVATPSTKWRKQGEVAFLNESRTIAMTRDIDTFRAEWDKPAYQAGTCRPKFVTELHRKKQARQEAWMAYLEKKVCEAMDSSIQKLIGDLRAAADAEVGAAATRAQNKLRNPAALNREKAAAAAATEKRIALDTPNDELLIIAALPEFFWRDVNDNRKHDDSVRPDYIPGYGKPFYAPVFERFITNTAVAAGTPPPTNPTTLRELTRKYPNLVVFAGTVWWKKIVNASACTRGAACGTDALPVGTVRSACTAALAQCEKMFNTLPVFYQGQCACLWNKQWISHIDGLGSRYDYAQKYVNRSFELSSFSSKPTMPNTAGSVIGLSAGTGFAALPSIAVTHGTQTITFGMDICLDFARGYDGVARTRTGGPLSKDMLGAAGKPDIQMLIAGGMPVNTTDSTGAKASRDGNIFAGRYLLRCDAMGDADKKFADVWSAGTPHKQIAGFDRPTAGYEPFGVFELN